ncbi:MAG: phosphodiester glycosidase family protein [Candidatus Promineifilaceae bacterium]
MITAAFWLSSCDAPPAPPPFVPLESETISPTIPPILPTETVRPKPLDTGWESLEEGMARRVIRIVDEVDAEVDRIVILRLDPTLYHFDVAYRPGEAQTLAEWSEETGALITMNGGFFTAEYDATGLTVVDGEASGWSYEYGGMVQIIDGVARVRSLAAEPYQVGEPIDAGLQAFPILVHPDGSGYTQESTNRARRTVIAQDHNGQIFLIVTARSNFTLSTLSDYLRASDLNLKVALNLDGATSTGLILTDPYTEIPAFVLLPIVLTVNRR